VRAEQEAVRVHQEAGAIALDEARARVAEAKARAKYAQRQVEIFTLLHEKGVLSELEFRQGRADTESAQATLRALELAVRRIEQERRTEDSDRQTRLAKLEREAVELEGEATLEAAAIDQLDYEIGLRRIRAPVSGQVGEVEAQVQAGSVVGPAEKLGAIVPSGEPRAVALFPAVAAGRIRPGQAARLHLTGFPWTRYGTLPATVTDVGNEAEGGFLRVELALAPAGPSPLPREHGLPASVEVEIERVSPATLVLRAAGELLAARRPADPDMMEPRGP
jgi:membrane fusion protein (multidrug efflux system)